MLEHKLEQARRQIKETGWTRMGGMMPGPIQDKHITPVMLSFALQRTCGWVVSPEAIARILDGRR